MWSWGLPCDLRHHCCGVLSTSWSVSWQPCWPSVLRDKSRTQGCGLTHFLKGNSGHPLFVTGMHVGGLMRIPDLLAKPVHYCKALYCQVWNISASQRDWLGRFNCIPPKSSFSGDWPWVTRMKNSILSLWKFTPRNDHNKLFLLVFLHTHLSWSNFDNGKSPNKALPWFRTCLRA